VEHASTREQSPVRHLQEAVVRGQNFLGAMDQRASVEDLARRIEEVATNEVTVFEKQFRRNGLDVLIGKASFIGTHDIRIENG
jgi:NAD(P) transhydrogenase